MADRGLSTTPHYYEIQGRAAEIARAMGSPTGGAEHMFLGMLHDGRWPVSVLSDLVDLGRAEAAVLSIVNDPGYSPPPPPKFLLRNSSVQTWGVRVAFEMGDCYLGLEHALLEMIRMRDTIPARSLAGLADLDALETAVLEAKNTASTGPGAHAVFLPDGQALDEPLVRALIDALPEDTTFGFNSDASGRTWIHVIGPGDNTDREVTRQVLNAALASLHRPVLEA